MSARTSGAALLLAASGCTLDNPVFHLDTLEELVAPARIVLAVTGTPLRPTFDAVALDDGGSVQWIVGLPNNNAVCRTTATGESVCTLLSTDPWFQAVSLGDEAYVAECPYTPRAGLTDPAEGWFELSIDAQSVTGFPGGPSPVFCHGAYFRGAGADRVLQLAALVTPSPVYLHVVDRAARTETMTLLVEAAPLPVGAVVLLAWEDAPGDVSYLANVDGALLVVAPDGTPTPTGLDAGFATAWLGQDGAVRIATPEALFRWDGAAPVRLADVPESPVDADWFGQAWPGGAIAEATEPNALAPEALVPTGMAVRFATDDAFVVFTPPLTPCADREDCRVLGETYLLGGFGGAAGPLVAYDHWSWVGTATQFTHAVVVGPVREGNGGGGR